MNILLSALSDFFFPLLRQEKIYAISSSFFPSHNSSKIPKILGGSGGIQPLLVFRNSVNKNVLTLRSAEIALLIVICAVLCPARALAYRPSVRVSTICILVQNVSTT